jgi:hypothetical protein
MKNILIDTCSLINLLSEDKNKLLPHLEFWKQNNCISIVTHKLIIEEWNKHKEKQKKKFEDSLKTKYKHTQEISQKEKLIIPDNLVPNLENIDNQIKAIDEILNDCIKLDTPSDIKIFCSDRTIGDTATGKKKAPYHNKLDSTKDAYIIFSALQYFSGLGQDFLFISDNKSDFGSPNELETKIHPEIVEDYPSINVQYRSDIARAIHELKKELPVSLLPETANNVNADKKGDELYLDKTKPLLEQIYDFILARHKEISFYPISLLINQYPFSIKSNSYYTLFTLNTDNEELFELFKSIEIRENNEIIIKHAKFFKGLDDYTEKIKTVLLGLSNNLIFNISNSQSNEYITIRYAEEKNCDCPKCCFNKFKFSDCFKNLNIYTDCLEDLQISSYLNYQIGNYLFAIEKQKKALAESKKKHLNTSAFISQFNLSKLSIFARSNYFEESSKDEIIQELRAIDLEYEETKLSTTENKKLLKYLRENSFFTDASDKIQEISRKLIDQYYSSLNGGWNSNNYVWSLVNDFAKLESFVVNNFIVYDKFMEFQHIFSVFMEGLFASHAIENNQHSRLDSIDDWMITNIIKYGDSETISKYYLRYKIKKLRYRKSSSEGDSFSELVVNFFSNKNLREVYLENCEINNIRFWEYHDNVFKNIITLVSISDFDDAFINLFSKQLIEFLKRENFTQPYTYNHISTFLYRCGESLNSNLIDSFFDLGLNSHFMKDSRFHNALLYVIDKKRIKVTINPEQFKAIQNIIYNESEILIDKDTASIIVSLYQMIDNVDYKQEISRFVKAKLDEEFSFDVFYLATFFELIPLNEDMLNKAIKISLPQSGQVSLESASSGIADIRSERVNSILNLCFKLNVDTTQELFQQYRTLAPYYNWLIDMDKFDYDFFDYKWIGEYNTRYYYEKIHDCIILKDKLEMILKEKFDDSLEKNYLNIFVRKTWKIEK